jgi:hypothetical protein
VLWECFWAQLEQATTSTTDASLAAEACAYNRIEPEPEEAPDLIYSSGVGDYRSIATDRDTVIMKRGETVALHGTVTAIRPESRHLANGGGCSYVPNEIRVRHGSTRLAIPNEQRGLEFSPGVFGIHWSPGTREWQSCTGDWKWERETFSVDIIAAPDALRGFHAVEFWVCAGYPSTVDSCWPPRYGRKKIFVGIEPESEWRDAGFDVRVPPHVVMYPGEARTLNAEVFLSGEKPRMQSTYSGTTVDWLVLRSRNPTVRSSFNPNAVGGAGTHAVQLALSVPPLTVVGTYPVEVTGIRQDNSQAQSTLGLLERLVLVEVVPRPREGAQEAEAAPGPVDGDPAIVAGERIDPDAARRRALRFPGGGHFYTGETTRGAALLGGSISALAIGGLLSTGEERYDPDSHSMKGPSRVPLGLGIMAAGAFWYYGVRDAPNSAARASAGAIAVGSTRVRPEPLVGIAGDGSVEAGVSLKILH